MTRSILVGLDGSNDCAAAVNLGLKWAKQQDALLVGLGIIDEPTIRQPESLPIGGSAFKEYRDDAVMHAASRRVEQFLEHFALRCAEARVACKLLENIGDPVEQLALEAQRYDLMILGKKTHFQYDARDKSDTTLRKILKRSPRPVVAVPRESPAGNAVVVAYDGSAPAARALQAFRALELTRSDPIHIVAVDTDHAAAVRHAERAIDYLSFHGIRAQRHIVESSSPATAIMETAQSLCAGLVVMGTSGQSALTELIFGSVTRALLEDQTISLFLYY